MASVSSARLRPMSSMIAFAPSWRRSRWRSRKAGWPAVTRSPSHTPSPRTKPESNTETTAFSRGTSRPFTEIRMCSLRGSSSKSWVPWAIRRNPKGAPPDPPPPLRLAQQPQRLRGRHVPVAARYAVEVGRHVKDLPRLDRAVNDVGHQLLDVRAHRRGPARQADVV